MSIPQPSTYNAVAFGRMILAWRRQASWSHSTAQSWGEQAGFPHISNGNWSRIENAKIKCPELATFLQLEILNERAFTQNYRGISNSALYERAKALRPILRDNGRPWTYHDFTDVFIGRKEPPDWLVGPVTAEDAKKASENAQKLFERTAKARTMSSTVAWQELLLHLEDNGLPPNQIEKLRLVVTGWEWWNESELTAMQNSSEINALNLLKQWGEE